MAFPCVGFRGGASGAGEDVIRTFQEIVGEGECECAHGAMQWVECSRADDGCGDGWLLEEPLSS